MTMEKTFTKKDIIKAHDYSSNNKESLSRSKICGCFYCEEIFNPAKIDCWLRDSAATAFCPNCSVDSIIGDDSGYPITKEFLSQMYIYWFDTPAEE